MEECTKYFNRFLEEHVQENGQATLPSMGQIKRAYFVLKQVRAFIDFAVGKARLGSEGARYHEEYEGTSPASEEDMTLLSTDWGNDYSGWINTCYYLLLAWRIYEPIAKSSITSITDHFSLPENLLPISAIEAKEVDKRRTFVEKYFEIELARLPATYQKVFARVIVFFGSDDYDNLVRHWHDYLYESALEGEHKPYDFARTILNEVLLDYRPNTCSTYGKTDQDWNFPVWIVAGMGRHPEEFQEQAMHTWLFYAINGSGASLYEGYENCSGESMFEKGFYRTPTGHLKDSYLEWRKQEKLLPRGERMWYFARDDGFEELFPEAYASLKVEWDAAREERR